MVARHLHRPIDIIDWNLARKSEEMQSPILLDWIAAKPPRCDRIVVSVQELHAAGDIVGELSAEAGGAGFGGGAGGAEGVAVGVVFVASG